MNRKMRIYPPVIVATVVLLAAMIAGAVSINTEAERQATIQPYAAELLYTQDATASTTEGQASSETEATSGPEATYTSAIRSRDWGS